MSLECAFLGSVNRDAELKISKAGKAYVRLTVHVGDGDAAQWISLMYFGADAAELAPKLTSGTRIYVEGSLRLDRWDGKDGVPHSGLSCMSFHCRIAEIGRNKPKRDPPPGKPNTAPADGTFHDDGHPVRGGVALMPIAAASSRNCVPGCRSRPSPASG